MKLRQGTRSSCHSDTQPPEEVKHKEAAPRVFLKGDSHSPQVAASKPHFIHIQLTAGISRFNRCLYRLLLPNHTTCRGLRTAQATFRCTCKYWNEPVKHLPSHLNRITFGCKLPAAARCVLTHLVQLKAKRFWMFFPVLQKTKNVTLRFTTYWHLWLRGITDHPSPLACLDLKYFSPP